jgi:hypothetical protein
LKSFIVTECLEADVARCFHLVTHVNSQTTLIKFNDGILVIITWCIIPIEA